MVQRIIGVLLLAAASVFAEGGGAVSFDGSALDGTKLDLAAVRFSFAAPCTFLVTGVVYDGVAYAALLEYDGERALKVREATAASPDAFSSLDLSHAFLAAAEGAVVLRNVLIDGYAYTLDVSQVATDPAVLSLAESAVSDVPIAAVRVVPSTSAREAEAAAAASNAAAAAATARADTAAAAATAAATREKEAVASAAASAREVETLKASLAERDKEIASLKGQAEAAAAANAAAAATAAAAAAAAATAAAATPPAPKEVTLLSGLVAPASPFGTWSASDAGLAQNDSSLLFAKYPAAVDQSANEIVYRLSMKSLAPEGWVGAGIHILATGAAASDGWGYGKSLLVWITRDPRTYGDSKTRLQVYLSSSPVDMTAVSTIQVTESLNDETAVEITVRRDAGTVAVAVGGDRKLLYTAPAPLTAGDRVALRSLGPMLFTRFWMGTR